MTTSKAINKAMAATTAEPKPLYNITDDVECSACGRWTTAGETAVAIDTDSGNGFEGYLDLCRGCLQSVLKASAQLVDLLLEEK